MTRSTFTIAIAVLCSAAGATPPPVKLLQPPPRGWRRPDAVLTSTPRFAERNAYSFQSEQSQPSSCSILEMSSTNRL